MPTNYFEKLKLALGGYDKRKGFWRRWFGDQTAIKKLRSLSPNDHDNLFKICQCFFKNTPKPSQASYQVYQKLANLGKFSNLCLKKFQEITPSHKQQINLESKVIQELISNNIIAFEQALSLNPIQRGNLELDVVQNLIAKKIISLDQVLSLSDSEQTNLGSEAIQKLILDNEVDFNQALSLNPIQLENLELSVIRELISKKVINLDQVLDLSKVLSDLEQTNLGSKTIQELILDKEIHFNQALSLQSIQRENLELPIIRELIYKEVINLDQVLDLSKVLSDLEQTNLRSEAIQNLILDNEIDFNQALSLNEKQRKNLELEIVQDTLELNEVLISAQPSNSLVHKKSQTSIPDASFGETPFLSLEQMFDLIEEKKIRGRDLNAFVFSMEKHPKDNLKLVSFFKLLAKNINNKEIPAHFQLAIRDEDNHHWFVVDCYLEKGHLYLLILDPAQLDTTLCNLLLHFPGSSFKDKTIFYYEGMIIQRAGRGCSFFAANLIFRLSNKTEHWEHLKSYLQQNSDASIDTIFYRGIDEPNLPYITLNEQELPPSLAFIFKNIQSLRASKALPDILKSTCINKKGQTLRKAINTNLKKIKTEAGEEKLRNLGITQKMRKYIKRLLSYQVTKSINFFKLTQSTKSHSVIQGFEVIGGEEGKIIKQILHSYYDEDISILETLVTKNEIFFNSSIKFMLEIVIHYSAEDFFLFLLKNNCLEKLNALPYIDDLIRTDNFFMFKTYFEYKKDTLTHEGILDMKNNTIGNWVSSEFTSYLSTVAAEFQPQLESVSQAKRVH